MSTKPAADAFEQLLQLTAHLRSPKGCAWDRAQTVDTLRPHLVEEFHELLEALDEGGDERFRDELGDLMFLVVFMARIAEEEGRFSMNDVLSGIDDKLRRRHPHVFGSETASTPDEVRATWEAAKLREGSHADRASLLDGLPANLPALIAARRLQEKAASVGFDWNEVSLVLAKIDEELAELRAEIDRGEEGNHREELGDLLFAIVNVARFLSIDPEAALRSTNLKFRRRFASVEEAFRGKDLRQVGLEAMDRVWNDVKKKEKKDQP